MEFVPGLELLRRAAAGGYAVPAFCAWDAEMVAVVLSVAERLRAPVMVMSGPGEFPLMSPGLQARVARAVAAGFDAPAALHLDHGVSVEQAAECLEAGYTSLMLDLSARPFAENVAGLRRVVEMARPRGVSVEGEIGAVGRVGEETGEGAKASTLTDPDEARRYVEETGVDFLAVSIGNAHGIYTRLPRLDFDRLERIHRAVDAPLVLHGGSGTGEADLRRAIALGIAKVNVASELCKAYRDSLTAAWRQTGGWVPEMLAGAMTAVAQVVEKWVNMTGAAGRAAAAPSG
jgi:ketose-bisphosphate aldolase